MLSLFWNNALNRLERVNTLQSLDIKFADQIRNCEDALLVEEHGLAILGCDPARERWNTVMGIFLPGPYPRGSVWVYDYASGSDSLTELELVGYEGDDLHPLGMAYDSSSSTLYMANHRTDGSRLDLFDLDFKGGRAVAKHRRFIKHPLIHTPNSIAVINNREIYVTNDHYFAIGQHGILARIETYAAIPGGNVIHVDLATDTARVLARIPFANGIELLNDTTLAVSSTSSSSISIFEIEPKAHNLTLTNTFKVPFMPDNLSVDKNGALLIAGHPHPPSLTKFAETRALCNSEEGNTAEVCRATSAGSWISDWTAEGGRRDLYVGTLYPSSCTALRDVERKTGIVTGLYGKGILVWKE
ncbi:putative paraoxonase [Thelonectria olida]|uniref:Paraoxonase n=1 Tax=Thelonectria olida TaxID=1576542 RepID=A0A9P9ALD1_9HYPO|nr:putative paraoxonase [Thelonectria olida]